MGFPVVASVTPTVFDLDTTEHLVAMPATVDVGDLLLVLFTNDTNATVATPTGWTSIFSTALGGQGRLSGYIKDAVGDEGGTTVDFVTSVNESAVAQVYRITAASWAGSTVTDVEDGTPSAATTNAPNPPPVTVSWGDASDTLFIVAVSKQADLVEPTSYPTNYGSGVHTAGSGEFAIASARRELNTDVEEDPGAYDLDGTFSRNCITQTIAIEGTAPSSPVVATPTTAPFILTTFAPTILVAPAGLDISVGEYSSRSTEFRLEAIYASLAGHAIPDAPRSEYWLLDKIGTLRGLNLISGFRSREIHLIDLYVDLTGNVYNGVMSVEAILNAIEADL